MPSIICLYCGKQVKAKNIARKYCNGSCRNSFFRIKKRKSLLNYPWYEWPFIPGFEELYRISVRGELFSERGLKIMKPSLKNGYPFIGLHKNGVYIGMYVHRAVALTYLPNPERKPCINHKDGIRVNSYLSNIEWATYSENIRHRDTVLGYVYPTKKRMYEEAS